MVSIIDIRMVITMNKQTNFNLAHNDRTLCKSNKEAHTPFGIIYADICSQKPFNGQKITRFHFSSY